MRECERADKHHRAARDGAGRAHKREDDIVGGKHRGQVGRAGSDGMKGGLNMTLLA